MQPNATCLYMAQWRRNYNNHAIAILFRYGIRPTSVALIDGVFVQVQKTEAARGSYCVVSARS